jgi:hypothetical protein
MEIENENEKFLKINPGEAVQFHILSQDPMKTVNHWVNKKKIECEGKTCDYCAQGDKPKKGWKVKVWDRKSLTVKDYEFGSQVAAQIKNIAEILSESQQTVDDIDFRIKREGAGQLDTEYFVNQVPSKESIPGEARALANLPF